MQPRYDSRHKRRTKRRPSWSRWQPERVFWRDYTLYLQSEDWQYLREIVFARARGVCEVCRQCEAQHVHHLTYTHVFNERLDELQAVCFRCHDRLHGGKLSSF
jgi:5-methylcytosine-specific restriction endonuclease McrA